MNWSNLANEIVSKATFAKRKFFKYTTGIVVFAGVAHFLISDTSNFERPDLKDNLTAIISLQTDEKTHLILASLAPSGHNTQILVKEKNQKIGA